ncbi:hypothetical protein BGZ57DRAFT_926717 [Hyaloscypha finlandica]|nr:hypothetical protein BGZ57DRAFT_926717 [Hyaloscypha finlandica]
MVSTRAAQASPRTLSITSLTFSPEELSTKTLAPRHLQAALEALHRDGIPLLSNAIPTSDLDILNSRWSPKQSISTPSPLPTVQPTIPKGALIIRDLRLWYAGMPNQMEEPRVTLVSIHFSGWYRTERKILLLESVKGKIEWGHLVPFVEYVLDGYAYLQGQHDHDFDLLP